jgi:hypothetical protein
MEDTTVVTEQTTLSTGGDAAAVAASEPVHGNPAAEEARRQLYEKHYGSSSEEATPAGTSSEAPVSATAAQADPTPVGTSSAPAVASLPPEVLEALRAVQNELAAVKNQIKPAAPATATPPAEPEPGWIALLREGRVKEAEDALAEAMAKRAQAPMVEQAVARTREIMTAQNQVEQFVNEVRAANPDLLVLESYITAEAARALEVVKAAGKIKTTEDAVREYKRAVLDATDTARKLHQTIRGSGKTEAMVRNKEVLSASTLAPQQLNQRTEAPAEASQPEPESMSSYFENRKKAEASRRGMG